MTGAEVDPAKGTTIEEHIEGDIAFSFQQYWQAHRNRTWLAAAGYDVIHGIAQFWVSKAVRNNDGSYSIPNIMGPDEYHGGVTDSVYCNVIAQYSLTTAYKLATVVGQTPNATFLTIANNLRILFNTSSQTHPEFQDYKGDEIKQADVILLGYPLAYNMSQQVQLNDLNYYASRTNPGGPAMTWSMFSVGYRECNEPSLAADYFVRGFAANVLGPYKVWHEVLGGKGCPNFITGAGGFLQSVWAGYGGLRIHDDGLHVQGAAPVPNATALTLQGVSVFDSRVTVQATSNGYTVEQTAGGSLYLRDDGRGDCMAMSIDKVYPFGSNDTVVISPNAC